MHFFPFGSTSTVATSDLTLYFERKKKRERERETKSNFIMNPARVSSEAATTTTTKKKTPKKKNNKKRIVRVFWEEGCNESGST